MTDPSIDLLSPRRAELGLPSVQSPALPTGVLLLRGAVVAAVVLLISGVVVVMVGWKEQDLLASKTQLMPYAAQADQLQKTMSSVRKQSQSLQQSITSITNRLVSIRSGSALLEQLKRVTPSSVQLRRVSVDTSRIQVEGVVQQQRAMAGPLEQINSFILNVEGLAGVPDEGAVLQQVSRSDDGVVQFDLDIKVDPSHQPTAEELSELGAEGLARRYQWLRERGLPL